MTDILIEFKKQLVLFFDELIEQFPSESDFIIVRIFINDQIPIENVMNYFIKELLPLKDMVKQKDEAFFIKNNILFSAIDKTKVNHFKRLWRSDSLTEDDKNIIWEWFSTFIFLGEKYQKAKSMAV